MQVQTKSTFTSGPATCSSPTMVAGCHTRTSTRNGYSLPTLRSAKPGKARIFVTSLPSARIAAAKLHSVYQAWGRHNGMKPWTQNGFGRAMAERGYRKVKSGTYFWVDIELVRNESDFRAEPEAPNEPPDNAAV